MCVQAPVSLIRHLELYKWHWLCVVAAPRTLWRDKLELYHNGMCVADESIRYPVIKKVTEGFIGGYVCACACVCVCVCVLLLLLLLLLCATQV